MTRPDPLAAASKSSPRCGKCEQPVRWLTSTIGPVEVDAEPDRERGTVALLGGMAAVLPSARAAGARSAGVEVYALHTTTCPFGRGR